MSYFLKNRHNNAEKEFIMVIKTQEEKDADRLHAIEQARWVIGGDYCVIDTETTGLKNAQACQIALLGSDGFSFKSLVKPTISIEPEAQAVHHITDDDVRYAPTIVEVISRHFPLEGMIVIYNAKFDLEILRNSLRAYNATWGYPENEVCDVMLMYAAFHGEWNDYHGNYKWQKLGVACEQCGIEMEEGELHDALTDVKMTEKLLKYMASQSA